ncbi:hypothetical protein LAZ67_2001894 [Cordylochernes scorpioides]|uniref:Uncharacterized protein n=1 Tax=Cordylochernes scorpioides TaxID=51811 RepID=A0ABY6K6C1_9ARAC|nr:hypothetical protein LAZ67_2001894 [Cordylochernes scorpioides]
MDNLTVLAVNATVVDNTPVVKLVHDVLIVLLLVAVMFAMGCHITCGESYYMNPDIHDKRAIVQVWNHIRKPAGVLIGMASQFVLLPLAAFGLMTGLGLDALHATGMLVLSCSPGGVTSNIFTYFCDGDVSLSITMTTCSTLVALGMMPFNMWLYGHHLETGNIHIPYEKMAISLAAVTAPVGAGMAFRWKAPKFAPYITKVSTTPT